MRRFKPFAGKVLAGLEGQVIDVSNVKIHNWNAIVEGGFSCVYLARDDAICSQAHNLSRCRVSATCWKSQ